MWCSGGVEGKWDHWVGVYMGQGVVGFWGQGLGVVWVGCSWCLRRDTGALEGGEVWGGGFQRVGGVQWVGV